MPRSVKAKINGLMLSWTRREAGLDEGALAKLLKKKAEDVVRWESGEAFPTIRQARALARYCDQPFAALFLPDPPRRSAPTLKDFRRLPEAMGNAQSRKLRIEIRRSFERREVELELCRELGKPVRSFGVEVGPTDSPASLATKLRAALDLSADAQKKWGDNRKAFSALREKVSALGVEVFQSKGIKVAEMRGFSINEQPLPVIVLNRQDSYAGRLFTLIHELVHVIKNVPSLCDLDESAEHYQATLHEEVFCNAVAGNFLVPTEDLLGQEVVKNHQGMVWNDELIEHLARQYSVSREVILRRLLDLGKTNTQFYEAKRRQYSEAISVRPKRKGYLSPSADAISRLGANFVGLVTSAYASEVITINDASDYTGLKVGQLENLLTSSG